VSGYGVHSRQIFKWLESRDDVELYVQPLNWGNTTWMINPDMEGGLVQRIMDKSKDFSGKYDLSFQVQLPDEWDPTIAIKNVGISAVVETDRCNPKWIECMDKMDSVIVPTEHIKSVIENTGFTGTPVHVVPEAYIEQIDNPEIEPLDISLDTSFNFLMVGQFTGQDPWSDRKNLYYTIKWFCEAFKDNPDVGLIVKANHGRSTRIDRNMTKGALKKIISEVRTGEYPKVHLLHGLMSETDMASLYRRSDVKCLISLTRGEGFGLPLLEAAACGIPVMATNWSGHLDFLKLGKFLPINYKMIEIPENRVDNRIFFKGMRWADPSQEDFKKKAIKFKEKASIPQKWASDLSHKVKEEFSLQAIIKKYNSFLKEEFGV
jgi:glycosyltransferase involved in cell wall biosynthesis